MNPNFSVRHRGRLFTWIEALAVFVLGFVVMNIFYAGTVSTPGAEIGVPGHDSFYHIAMASILPKVGAMPEFPWLEYVYFRDEGSAFVSHHWGFHLLLLPFVKAAEWMKGDGLTGGRWAMSAVFATNLLLFHLLLRRRNVPLHWLWIALFFLLPDQYFARHGFVRAIGASLMFMQLILLALFSRRLLLAGLAVGAYVHLYLGAVMFGPVLVAIFAMANIFGSAEDREFPIRLILFTTLGWVIGVVSYPYAGGIFEFLRLQVFGSGLSPDIEVGREWKPYSDAWFLVTMAGTLLVAWTGALLLRLRMGPRLNAEETTLMVLNLAFLVLTFKARRFIEYWPPVCLLSAAYLAAPPLSAIVRSTRSWVAGRSEPAQLRISIAIAIALSAACFLGWSRIDRQGDASWMLAHWYIWATPLVLIALSTIGRTWSELRMTTGPRDSVLRAPLFVRATIVIVIATLLPVGALAVGARGFSATVDRLECYYDLEEVQSMMTFLEENSEPGDLLFTDDWDVFPLFFYYNRHNHYIVGLDPKFTHERDPDLWNRYVKISRGQVPSTIQLASSTDGTDRTPVALDDIRDHFQAQYVIADRDHRSLAEALSEAPDFAELVYPSSDYEESEDATYLVFRIRDAGEAGEIADRSGQEVSGPLFLSDLRPLSVSQGWGDLRADRTVDGYRIRLNGRSYGHGLGTHAPSRILYEIPEGYGWLETTVGIDDETDGRGSTTVSILLDGSSVYDSPKLRGGHPPAVTRIPLDGARQVQLEANPTSDGQQHDHVCWADIRLVPLNDAATLEVRSEPSTAAHE